MSNQVCQEGLSNSDKAYFDGLNQKTVAQLGAKIDAQSLAVSRDMKKQVDDAKVQIKEEIVYDIKASLKNIAIGLGGIIIVVMAVFRLVEYKFQYTKKIKKYEAELEKKNKEFDDNIKKIKEQVNDNNILKEELLVYKNNLDKYAVSLGIQPKNNINQTKTELIVPTPTKSIIKKNVKKQIVKRIFTIIFVLLLLYLLFDKFLSGAKLVV